jgi:hypothetical protein
MTEKLEKILGILDDLDTISVFKKWFEDSEDKLFQFAELISTDGYSISSFLNISLVSRRSLLLECFPERNPISQRDISKYLLNMYGLRYCKSCMCVKTLEEFRPNIGRYDGLNGQCASCQSKKTKTTQPNRQAKYKAASIERIVPWSNLEEISLIYSKCPEGYHVDHIVPLQGTYVSGLHVSANLQYLTAEENIKKHNKFIAE